MTSHLRPAVRWVSGDLPRTPEGDHRGKAIRMRRSRPARRERPGYLTRPLPPGTAASLREGLNETITVLRRGVLSTLARTLRSTNCIESMIEICLGHSCTLKRWRGGQMALCWCVAGMRPRQEKKSAASTAICN